MTSESDPGIEQLRRTSKESAAIWVMGLLNALMACVFPLACLSMLMLVNPPAAYRTYGPCADRAGEACFDVSIVGFSTQEISLFFGYSLMVLIPIGIWLFLRGLRSKSIQTLWNYTLLSMAYVFGLFGMVVAQEYFLPFAFLCIFAGVSVKYLTMNHRDKFK